ncbi:hemerythrin domain-containing protein [Sphingomonas crusticola]|uniref:hemerythrin domain-containing protein n=1 Tax=Sphingomonas crusticola TaxID=1697973 RepID=UPI000E220F69|nr:hemerythrin domain-containing protein [Sphingomonas crusticola]
MATTPTASRARTTSAKRSANARAEARDEDGRFEKEASAKTGSAKRPARKSPARNDSGASTGQMLAAGAAGLAVGLAANVARKLAVQSPTYFAGEWDQALKAEHELTLKVFDAIEATTEKNTTKRSTLLMNLKHMLAKHALEEENTIYPAMRDAGEAEAADHLNNDHGYVKQYLYDLTVMPKDSLGWIAKVRQFRADIEKHMREEETSLFPMLKAKLSPEKNKELTAAMNKEGLKIA